MIPSRWRWLPILVVWLAFVTISIVLFRNAAHVFAPTADAPRLGISFNPQPVLFYAIAVGALIMLTVW